VLYVGGDRNVLIDNVAGFATILVLNVDDNEFVSITVNN
jgi:hypothetical protein